MEIDPKMLQVTVTNDVRIELTGVAAKFKPFEWTYTKTSVAHKPSVLLLAILRCFLTDCL